MKTKICSKCKNEYPATLEYFHFRNDSGKYRNECKICCNKISRIWQTKNREKVNEYCRIKRKEKPDYYNAIAKRYRDRNPEKRYKVCTEWRKKNKEKSNAIQKRSYTKRRATLKGNLDHRIGVAIQRALRENKNGRKWESLVGYTLNDLKKHLEKKFQTDMTWDRFLKGEIHVDHIIPISIFNFTSPKDDDFKRCWALSNLQPMWAKENLSKGAKLDKPFQPSLIFN